MLRYGYLQHLADKLNYALTGDLDVDESCIEAAIMWQTAINTATPKPPKNYERETCAICNAPLKPGRAQLCAECAAL